MTKSFLLLFSGIILLGCNPSVEAINFGNDECSFCKMSIVDQRYGAEIVTSKGKVFKFDALECMINALCDNQNNTAKLLHSAYVIDFSNPGNLIDAKTSFYLFSEKLPSPMGAYLTSFSDSISANKAEEQFKGEIFNWESVVLKVVEKRTCEYDF